MGCYPDLSNHFGESVMSIVRFILALAILLLAAYIVVMNWSCVVASLRNKRHGIDRHYSTVPIMSFLLTALASLIYPLAEKRWMVSVPLLDIANWSAVWGFISLPVLCIREAKAKKTTEPSTAPNGGPAAPPGSSGVTEGPPSV